MKGTPVARLKGAVLREELECPLDVPLAETDPAADYGLPLMGGEESVPHGVAVGTAVVVVHGLP